MALATQLDSATRSRLSITSTSAALASTSSSSAPTSGHISLGTRAPSSTTPTTTLTPTHPLDANLASLDLKSIAVVEHKSAEFAAIAAYARDTNEGIGGWSVSSNMQVLEVFRIERYVEDPSSGIRSME